MTDRYEAIGWCRNPFALVDGGVPGPMIDLDLGTAPEPGRRRVVQVIGPKGSGKTTALRAWQRVMPGPYRHVPAIGTGHGRARVRPLPVAPIAYWDEPDRALTALRWLGLARSARIGATIVAATHSDLTPAARRTGFEVETRRPAEPDTELVRIWAQGRIEAASTAPARLEVPTAVIEDVLAGSRGSWRIIADGLHVWAAELAAAAEVLPR